MAVCDVDELEDFTLLFNEVKELLSSGQSRSDLYCLTTGHSLSLDTM